MQSMALHYHAPRGSARVAQLFGALHIPPPGKAAPCNAEHGWARLCWALRGPASEAAPAKARNVRSGAGRG